MIDLTASYTSVIPITSIYKTIPLIPKGFQVLGFRPVKQGEYVLITDGGYYKWTQSIPGPGPVIVIQKCKAYTFRFTGRHARPNNEWVADFDEKDRIYSFFRITSSVVQDIYEMVEE